MAGVTGIQRLAALKDQAHQTLRQENNDQDQDDAQCKAPVLRQGLQFALQTNKYKGTQNRPEEIAEAGLKAKSFELSKFFREEFFETKKVVFVPA